jgi:uncharacterized protein YndB with AHSA1/START domain
MKGNNEPIVVEQVFEASRDAAWRAITELDQMRQWYFEAIPAFKPEVGFETQFNVPCNERDFLHVWKVTDVVPLKMIRYDWRYEGYPGDSFVTFELSEADGATTLKLTHRVRESFPEDIPEFRRESCLEGWTYFIRKSLREFLEKR